MTTVGQRVTISVMITKAKPVGSFKEFIVNQLLLSGVYLPSLDTKYGVCSTH